MPGKYSHSVVLAHYSSRGIISIPNDQQTEYFTSDATRRAVATATATRARASSSAARSDHRSIPQGSIKASSERARPVQYDLSLRERPQKSRRRLIIESESESEVEESSNQYVIRLHPKSVAVPSQVTVNNQPLVPTTGAPANRAVTTSRDGQTARQSVSSIQSPPQQFGGMLRSPSLKGSTYVKALAKVESQSPRNNSLGTPQIVSTVDDSVTLFDFLRGQRQSDTQQNEPLSLQEFLSSASLDKSPKPTPEIRSPHFPSMLGAGSPSSSPRPKAGRDGRQPVPPENSPQKRLSTSEVPNPPRAPLPGSGLARMFETGTENKGLNLQHVSDSDIEPDFMQRLTVSTRPKSTAFPFSEPVRDMTYKRRSMGETGLSRTPRQSHEAASSGPAFTVGSSSAPRMIRRSRSRFEDHETSGSLGSLSSFSDFGIPSINRTPATSRQSNVPRSKAISEASYQSKGPAPNEMHEDRTMSIFEDSAEDDNDEVEEEIHESDMPVVDPDAIYASAWGQISSGQDVNPDDAMSEVDAACPPDINRYKYASGGGGPFAQLEQIVAEQHRSGPVKLSKPVKPSNPATDQRKSKPSKVGGLLDRFRRSNR